MKNNISSIPKKYLEILWAAGIEKEIKKGTFLTSSGKVCRILYFIKQGMIRSYRLKDGKDFTHHFYGKKWFATDYHSFLTGQPGTLYLETLTPCTVHVWDKSIIQQLYTTYPILERLGRIMAEEAYLLMAERTTTLQINNLKEKYDSLIRTHPDLILNVPQKYIASYLGVSEQSLSRIKMEKNQIS